MMIVKEKTEEKLESLPTEAYSIDDDLIFFAEKPNEVCFVFKFEVLIMEGRDMTREAIIKLPNTNK
ncbi:hypothetical protein L484_001180 [Morus notabilis]|uniref:Uncharacterized protein n=1 Tax=Morus notabilis TaxID=981085 RepID=W9QXH6_9ROSA|nr:hypothetical protein L484_001180 [Morus notabilis]